MKSIPIFVLSSLMLLASCNSRTISLEASETELMSPENLQLAKDKGLEFKCKCDGQGCKCCAEFLHQSFCAGLEVKLEDDELKLHETLKLGGFTLFDKTQEVGASKYCRKIPTDKIQGHACLGLEDIQVKEKSIRVCAKADVIIDEKPWFSGKIGCLNVPIPFMHHSTSIAH